MSRIGKNPVTLPPGVTVEVAAGTLIAKGKLGSLKLAIDDDVTAAVEAGKVVVRPNAETKRARMMWGTTRARIANMVRGVAQGFSANLEINGVGYRAAVQGKNLVLQLGYSHDITFPVPDDVKIVCERPTVISITGADKQRVGQVAAVLRAYRKPEPYKGKGVKYAAETVRRKEGKKK